MAKIDQATVFIDLDKLEANTRSVIAALGPGVQVVAVTKATAGSPQVARAMLRGGAAALGDSRLENIETLRDAGVKGPFWLLRAPSPGLAADTVRLADVSLASELASVTALDAAARTAGVVHRVVAMVDLGDLREGMMPEDLLPFLGAVEPMPGVEIAGIGTNLACYGGVVPSVENLDRLAELARTAEVLLGRALHVSGGNSSSIEFAVSHGMPPVIDGLRIGESILLGVSVLTREPILGLSRDVFRVCAPVIECKVKPSKPIGATAQDAFGHTPEFEDRGWRRRAICAIGRQDAPPAGLVPVDQRVEVLGASSDHLILDVEELPEPPAVGDAVEFTPTYGGLVGLFTSRYVRKVYVGG